jgi:hypothetical protein
VCSRKSECSGSDQLIFFGSPSHGICPPRELGKLGFDDFEIEERNRKRAIQSCIAQKFWEGIFL